MYCVSPASTSVKPQVRSSHLVLLQIVTLEIRQHPLQCLLVNLILVQGDDARPICSTLKSSKFVTINTVTNIDLESDLLLGSRRSSCSVSDMHTKSDGSPWLNQQTTAHFGRS